MVLKNEELKTIWDLFHGHCMFIETCIETIKDSHATTNGWAKTIVAQNDDVQRVLTEMINLAQKVQSIAEENADNDDIMRECSALTIAMISTIGKINDNMENLKKTINDEMKYTPKDISESQIRNFKMDWRIEK